MAHKYLEVVVAGLALQPVAEEVACLVPALATQEPVPRELPQMVRVASALVAFQGVGGLLALALEVVHPF